MELADLTTHAKVIPGMLLKLLKFLKLYITGCRQQIFSRMPELGEVWLKIRQLQLGGETCNDVVVN